jgi:hypothetical protein
MQAATFRRWILVGLISLGLMTMLAPAGVSAQPNVKIVFTDPDVHTTPEVRLGKIAEIKFIAQAAPPGLKLQWTCQGPGGFDGDTEGLSSIYLVPDSISDSSRERVTITVTAADDEGNTVQDAVTFTLRASEPPPTPQPTATPRVIPTPTPVPTPSPRPTATLPLPTPTPVPTPSPRPTATLPLPTPTPVPTSTPGPLPTPTIALTFLLNCPPQTHSLNELQESLPASLEEYKRLLSQEQNGRPVNRQLTDVIETIICDLLAIETILDEYYQDSQDADILTRLKRTRQTREQYEQEWARRVRQAQE